jgi:hypothetical protein
MTRRTRNWLVAVISLVATGSLVTVPSVAQAGITFNALDGIYLLPFIEQDSVFRM